jgi:hypothetical protein
LPDSFTEWFSWPGASELNVRSFGQRNHREQMAMRLMFIIVFDLRSSVLSEALPLYQNNIKDLISQRLLEFRSLGNRVMTPAVTLSGALKNSKI